MIKVKTKDNKYIGLIEVPKSAFYFDWKCISDMSEFISIYCETEDDWVHIYQTKFTSPNQFEIIGKLSELDKELEEYIDSFNYDPEYKKDDKFTWYKDYIYPIIDEELFDIETPKDSFISLIKLQHSEFDVTKEWLIIKIL